MPATIINFKVQSDQILERGRMNVTVAEALHCMMMRL